MGVNDDMEGIINCDFILLIHDFNLLVPGASLESHAAAFRDENKIRKNRQSEQIFL